MRVPKATPLAVWKFVHHCGSIAGEAFKTIIRGLGGYRLPQTGGCSHTSSVHTLPSWTDTPALLLFRLWCSSNALTRGQADHSLQDCKSTSSPSFFPSFRSSAVGTGNGARHFSLWSLPLSSLTRSEGGEARTQALLSTNRFSATTQHLLSVDKARSHKAQTRGLGTMSFQVRA